MITATGRYISYGTAPEIVRRIAGGVQKGCVDWANLALGEAKELVPVRTGELRDSGHVEVEAESDAVTASVIFDARHAQFVEFGTGTRGEGTYPGELPSTGVPITGAWQYDYRGVGWKGMPSRAYVRPAFDQHRDEALPIVQDAVDEVL